jgi:hypothetical protein
MDCRKIQKRISGYFGSQEYLLPEDITGHLTSCPECTAFTNDLLSLHGVLSESSLEVHPGELDNITFEKIADLASSKQKKGHDPAFIRRFWWILTPAAVASLALVIFFATQNKTGNKPDYIQTSSFAYSGMESVDDILASDSLGTELLTSMVGNDTELEHAADELISGSNLDDLLNGMTSDELKTFYHKLDNLKG